MLRKYLLMATLAAAGLAATPVVAQSVSDFQLQPSAPKPAPRAQGPVDEEGPVIPTAPRVVSTATPRPAATATASVPQPSVSQGTQTRAPGRAALPPQPRTTVRPPVPVTAAPATTPPPAVAATGLPPTTIAPALPVSNAAPAAPTFSPVVTPAPAAEGEKAGGTVAWLYLALAALGLLALGALGLWLRRRAAARPPAPIERPVVAVASPSTLPLAEALTVRAEVLKVTRSFAFVTTDYRLTLVNRLGTALGAFEVGADMVSAHAAAPVESQLAGPATVIETRHAVERLGPNQTMRLEGQVRLPLGQAQVIRQGRTPLLVPLLRVRAARLDAPDDQAIVKTLVVGQGTQGGGRVKPFDLSDTPRAYTEVAQRELA